MHWPIRTTLTDTWHLAVGPLDLWLTSTPAEIEAVWSTRGDEARPLQTNSEPLDPTGTQSIRIAVEGSTVAIGPRCAPIPVVARAERPILVGPGRSIRAWVSTPLWLQLRTDAGEGPEIPAQPVKHTWAGPTTEGHLCVAMRTLLRLNLENVVARDHRILTTVELHNHHDEPLRVERIALPMPMARVYGTDRGLWSETLRLVHRGERTDAETIGPPREAPNAVLISEARSPRERSALKNVFGAVLAGVS